MSEKCDNIRSQLQALEEQLRNTPKFLTECSQGGNREVNPEWTNLDSHLRRTRMSLQTCEGNE